MALSVALPLSGLETESFSAYSAFGLRSILNLSQSSPSPSISSDSSIGSEINSGISAPTSPQATEKKPEAPTPKPAVKVMHGGRDVLDLGKNMNTKGWAMRYAFLPSNNTSVFFANRSQYHRLAGYVPEYRTAQCKDCQFTYISE